jgi:hypothetical protein
MTVSGVERGPGMGGPVWQVLTGLPAWGITQIPRRDGARSESTSDDGADHGSAQRVQALAAAYQRGAPVAFGWVRDRVGGRVQVIAAGPGLAAAADGTGETILTLPAGARAWPLAAGGSAALFASLPCWTPVAVMADVLLADDEQDRGRGRTAEVLPSLEELLLGSWPGPFGWIVIAEPVATVQLREMASAAALAQLSAQRMDSPRSQLETRRAAARHAELRRAATTGLWDIWLLAGGSSPDAAAQIAGLLCASADLDGLPYALVPGRGCGALEQMLGGPGQPRAAMGSAGSGNGLLRDIVAMQPAPTVAPGARPVSPVRQPQWAGAGTDDGDPAPEFPCAGSSRLLAALARPPGREVPGIRFTLRPDFDVTPETSPAAGQGGVVLGTVLDQNRVAAGELAISLASLNRHVFVCGATGAGKSQTVRHLLESATRAGIPWLVIEPAKAEYKLMAARLRDAGVIVIRPGDLDVAPAGVNPLEPAAGPGGSRYPLQAHADLVRALFLAAFQPDEPFPQVLAGALTRCYEQAGWDLVTGEPAVAGAGYPGLADLEAAAMTVVEEIGYGREITDNVRGFVQVRIGSLRLGTAGRFVGGGHPLDFGRLLAGNVVLEIEDCGDDRDKAFLTGAVLLRLAEFLRMRQRAEGPAASRLRHLTVVEEAHRLLRQPPPGTGGGTAAHAVEMFAGLLAEIRAYGEGLIIAEQIPAKLIPDVIKNTAVKIVHRLPALDDRESVGATMNLTADQSRYLVTLVPGEAAVFADGMDYPVLARMPDGTARETAGTAPVMSPAGIIAARSASCAPGCGASPCTLRQMRAAQQAAARDPRITLWAELAVLAHLTGWLMPMAGPAFAAGLAAMNGRLRDCALSHAADEAVASRIPAISATVSGIALAEHVTAAMRVALDEGRWACDAHEPQWLAPAWQWAGLLDELRTWNRDHPGAGPHPRIQDLQARHARAIPGRTCAEQAAAVQRWHDAAQRNPETLRIVAVGVRSPSAVEQAIGARIADPEWDRRLAAALADFPAADWVPAQLALPDTEASP